MSAGTIFDGPLSSVAFCWTIERGDGGGLALTSHDCDLVVSGVTFRAAPGVAPASITRSTGLEPQSAEISGVLSDEGFDEQDLLLGRWGGARVALQAVDWSSPDSAGATLLRGELGELSIEGDAFSAELRGSAARLEEPVCPSTSPECRAELGDRLCRVDLAGRTRIATIVSAAGHELQLDVAVGEQFRFGRLRYLRGANCGVATTILQAEGSVLRVRDLPRRRVEPGCRVEIREGCDKRFRTCIERFRNAENFRGEPHLPGNDLLTRYPGV